MARKQPHNALIVRTVNQALRWDSTLYTPWEHYVITLPVWQHVQIEKSIRINLKNQFFNIK